MLFNYMLINVFPFSLMAMILIELKTNNHPRDDYRFFVIGIVMTMVGQAISTLLYLCGYFQMEGGWADLFRYCFVIQMLEVPLLGISMVLFFFQKSFGLLKLKKSFNPLHVAFLIPCLVYIAYGIVLVRKYGLAVEEGFSSGLVDLYAKVFLYIYYIAVLLILIIGRFYLKTLKRREYATYLFALLTLAAGGIVDSIFPKLMLEWGFFAASFWIIFIFHYEQHISTDALTGAYNRQSFDLMLSSYWSDVPKEERDSAFLFMIDCDSFKHINDVYGHATGDEALRILSKDIEGVIRPYESFFSRFGGDEFNVILTGVGEATAEAIKREIKTNLTRVSLSSSFSYPLTCSIGICSFAEAASIADLKQRADAAMYRDKKYKKVIKC